jgi:hypothetical protein
MAMAQLDRRLDSLLAELSARLGGSTETAIFLGADGGDDTDALAQVLVDAGLLLPAEPAGAMICDGCERICTMPVEVVPAIDGIPARAFIVCDKREDIGRVGIEPARLRRWIFSYPLLARALAQALKIDRAPHEEGTGQRYQLGKVRFGSKAISLVLVRSAESIRGDAGVIIALEERPDQPAPGSCMTLMQAFYFRNGRLVLRLNALRSAVASRHFGDSTVALEVRFEFGEVLLLDRIEGGSRKIAAPTFQSQTYRVFELLYDNPEHIFTTTELQKRTEIKALKTLHKFPENLNFRGNLKKLFFEVSQQAIRFRREVTLSQLAAHRIDVKTLI